MAQCETPERRDVREAAREKRRRKRGQAVEKFARKIRKKWRGKRIADIRFEDAYNFTGLQGMTIVMDDGTHLDIGTTRPTHRAQDGERWLIVDGRDTDAIHPM